MPTAAIGGAALALRLAFICLSARLNKHGGASVGALLVGAGAFALVLIVAVFIPMNFNLAAMLEKFD